MLNFFRKNILFRIIFLFPVFLSANLPHENLAVIVNPQSGISEMKYSELVSILKGEKPYLKNGTKASIALLKTSTKLGDEIAKTIYGISGDELNKYWLSLVFQGKVAAPNFFDSESDLKNFVAKNKGAIGIISAEALNENEKPVLIDGEKFLSGSK
jgi:hypothetical protein